jgi:molybdate transport system substrate-binding protein
MTSFSRRRCLHWLSQLLLIASASSVFAQPAPTVAAASSLKFALEEVAAQFEKETGQKIRLVFGSSGNFYTQIMQGAPFDLFLSADENFIFKLSEAGKTKDRGQVYAKARIGIMVPHASPLKADGQLKDLRQALADGRLKKLAIANPDHAPYGMRAKEALQKVGLWESVQSKLVFGENISQTAQFALSGSTQGGIIAQSLALSPSLAKLGRFDLIPEDWHQPLLQRMALMKNASPVAINFYRYIADDNAQIIMSRYGFAMPKSFPSSKLGN